MKHLRDRRGQSLVEFGLIVPVVLVALYIPADFGIGYFTAHLSQNAVREAARIGAAKTPFDQSEVASEVTTRLPLRLQNPGISAELWTNGSANCMQVVNVSVTGTYNFFLYQLMRLIGISSPNSLQPNLTRSAQMRYEFQPVDHNTPACTS